MTILSKVDVYVLHGLLVPFLRYHLQLGTLGFLLSRQTLRALGAIWDMAKDTLSLPKLGVTVPIGETKDGSHYEIDLQGKPPARAPKAPDMSGIRFEAPPQVFQ